MDHHTTSASSKKNVLPIRLKFIPRSLFKASPVGCFYLIERLIDGLAVDDPIDSIDEFFNVEWGWVSFLQITVIVILILASKGVDIGPYYVFQFR